MPYAGVRCQFAANLQVITPYGRGRSLPTWWPFSPGARICSSGPNALPLGARYSSSCIFKSWVSLRYLFIFLLRRSKEAKKKKTPCALWLRCLLAQRLQRELGNITVSCKFSVTSRKSFFCRIFLSLPISGRLCSSFHTLWYDKKVGTDQ